MQRFPDHISFIYLWRKYQKRVLENLDRHLENRHLHLVAPPGSGKTVLGLEVMLRVNKPTIILAPTLTIKQQWLQRFLELFLQTNEKPGWISTNIKQPAFLTITTYQALHSLFKTEKDAEEAEDAEETETGAEGGGEDREEVSSALEARLIRDKMESIGFGTVILDEAHHLRATWWKSAVTFRSELKNPTVIALTATPPYDVSPQEWKRYIELCGPIDEEISVAELVREGDLCPHQDYIYLSLPEREERKALRRFHREAARFIRGLSTNSFLLQTVENHPWIQKPDEHVEEILAQPSYYSSMVIFLKAVNHPKWKEAVRILGLEGEKVPPFSGEWAEELLDGVLFKDPRIDRTHPEWEQLRREVKRIGAEERRKVHLKSTPEWNRRLVQSASKLNSIEIILRLEMDVLGADLRMVILTDYIRKEMLSKRNPEVTKKLGVAPIFAMIVERFGRHTPVGVLTGSLVILPKSAVETADAIAKGKGISLTFRSLPFDEQFVTVDISDQNRSSIVSIVTEVFSRGSVRIIVGTAALLGEGWDAPCINSLIMASYVGSFMLSNQMRGRAIRVDKENPEKTGAIWHLACVDVEQNMGGHDLESLSRRFRSLVGLSVDHDSIESGISRTGIDLRKMGIDLEKKLDLRPIVSDQEILERINLYERTISENNEKTMERARNRHLLKDRWNRAIAVYEEGRMTEEIRIPDTMVPKPYLFWNTIKYLLFTTLIAAISIFLNSMQKAVRYSNDMDTIILIALLIAALYTLPKTGKTILLFFRHQSLEFNIREAALVLYRTMHELGLLEPEPSPRRIGVKKTAVGPELWMRGGTTYEKTRFLNALQEFLEPIENPRYILYRESKWLWLIRRKDYHAVPEELGRKKEYAELFLRKWTESMGPAKLIFTRTPEGRKKLVQARMRAMSAAFVERSERLSVWR